MMNNSLINTNLLSIERVLRSREVLEELALFNYKVKSDELEMKLDGKDEIGEQLEIITKELDSAKQVIEQPLAKEYISLGIIKDIEGGIKQIQDYYSNINEENEKLKVLGLLKSVYGLTRDQGLAHIDEWVSKDIDTVTQELQLVIVNVWTWKFYHSLLLHVRSEISRQMLAFGEQTPKYLEEDKPRMEWLGTQKNLAELFIELKAKGFIKDIDANAIKGAFTGSNTIDQILKPGTNKQYEPVYDQVYTTKYSPRFDAMKQKK